LVLPANVDDGVTIATTAVVDGDTNLRLGHPSEGHSPCHRGGGVGREESGGFGVPCAAREIGFFFRGPRRERFSICTPCLRATP
jgi:hypothetical protein